MKKSTSALLSSAFLFPGAGLFVLEQKKRAYFYLAVTGIFLLIIVADTYRKAQIIADRLVADMFKHGNVDSTALTQLIANLPSAITTQMKTLPGIFPAGVITGLTVGLVVLWAVGVVDTYWHGRAFNHS